MYTNQYNVREFSRDYRSKFELASNGKAAGNSDLHVDVFRSRVGGKWEIKVGEHLLPTNVQSELFNVEIGRFITMACLALLVYDYAITLSEEIRLIWTSTWSITKCLFILNRYSVFSDPLILMSFTFSPRTEKAFCLTGVRSFAWTSTVGILIAQIILKLRTWAIWEKHKRITILLVAEFMIAFGISVFFVEKYLEGVNFVPARLHGASCGFTFANRLLFVNFIGILVSETLVVILLVIKALQHFRHRRTLLMSRVFKDGLLYFLCILSTSVANVVAILIAPIEIHTLLVTFQRIMHSILCNRVLLHIRGVIQPEYEQDDISLPSLDSTISGSGPSHREGKRSSGGF